jgi:hypothetical protein
MRWEPCSHYKGELNLMSDDGLDPYGWIEPPKPGKRKSIKAVLRAEDRENAVKFFPSDQLEEAKQWLVVRAVAYRLEQS